MANENVIQRAHNGVETLEISLRAPYDIFFSRVRIATHPDREAALEHFTQLRTGDIDALLNTLKSAETANLTTRREE